MRWHISCRSLYFSNFIVARKYEYKILRCIEHKEACKKASIQLTNNINNNSICFPFERMHACEMVCANFFWSHICHIIICRSMHILWPNQRLPIRALYSSHRRFAVPYPYTFTGRHTNTHVIRPKRWQHAHKMHALQLQQQQQQWGVAATIHRISMNCIDIDTTSVEHSGAFNLFINWFLRWHKFNTHSEVSGLQWSLKKRHL